MLTGTIVETQDLLETIGASLLAGVGVTVIFSVAIWGVARFADLSRSERPLAAGGAAAVTILSLILTFGVVALGIVVMTSK